MEAPFGSQLSSTGLLTYNNELTSLSKMKGVSKAQPSRSTSKSPIVC
jgi:hypothetical protein